MEKKIEKNKKQKKSEYMNVGEFIMLIGFIIIAFGAIFFFLGKCS